MTVEASEAVLGEVVDGCTKLGTWVLTEWSYQASEMAKELDARTYGADNAFSDLASAAVLAAETGFLLASEALAAVAILSRQERYIVARTFEAPAGARLELAGPLVSGHGHVLPVTLLSLVPSDLGPGESQFELRADATLRRSGTYEGTVLAHTDGAAPVELHVLLPIA